MAGYLLHGEVEIGGDFIERNSLVVFKPIFRTGDGARFFFALRLVIDRHIADRHSFGIDQHFEQANHSM